MDPPFLAIFVACVVLRIICSMKLLADSVWNFVLVVAGGD